MGNWALVRLARGLGRGARHPAVTELRERVAGWRDPRARALRRRRRAARVTTAWGGLTAVVAGVDVGEFAIAAHPGLGAYVTAGACVLLAGVTTNSGMQAYRLYREPLPPSPPRKLQLPPATSVARAPMERLAVGERSLFDVLGQLTSLQDSLPRNSVDAARGAGEEAAGRLRGLASRVQAVERARAAAPPNERASLDAAVQDLGAHLDAGVQDYGRLVAAAGRAVAAGSGNVDRQSGHAVTDAIDRLQGLAAALKDLNAAAPESG
jgi:hypothetical protein